MEENSVNNSAPRPGEASGAVPGSSGNASNTAGFTPPLGGDAAPRESASSGFTASTADNSFDPKQTGSATGTPPVSKNAPGTGQANWQQPSPPNQALRGLFARLRRSGWYRSSNRVAGGVCAGLAEKWNIDPIIVRGITVVLMLPFGLAMLLYGLAWFFLPGAPDGRIPAEDIKNGAMKGTYILPILLAFFGLARVFPGIIGGLSLLGATPLFMSGIDCLDSEGCSPLLSPPYSLVYSLFPGLFLLGIAIITWISYLIAKRRYSTAVKTALVIALALLGLELVFLTVAQIEEIGYTPAKLLLTMTVVALPLALVIWLIVWLVTKDTQPSYPDGYQPTAGYTTGFSTTPPYNPQAPGSGFVPQNTATAKSASTGTDWEKNSSSVFTVTPTGEATVQFADTATAHPAPAALAAANSPVITGIDPATGSTTIPLDGPAKNSSGQTPYQGYTQRSTSSSGTLPYAPYQASPLATKPRVAGPSPAFNLALLGLLVLVNLAAVVALMLGASFIHATLVALGGMSALLGFGMLVLALRRRRQSWVSWAASLLTLCLTLPLLLVGGLLAEIRDSEVSFPDIGRNWRELPQQLQRHRDDVNPGENLQSLTGYTRIDLRNDPQAGQPITVSMLDGSLEVFLHPDQPAELHIEMLDGTLQASTMSSWEQTSKIHQTAGGFFSVDSTAPDRPQYFDVSGENVTFTDYERTYEDDALKEADTLKIRNAAAKKAAPEDTQVVHLELVSGDITIFERPRETLWTGTVLPSGHFLVNWWLNENAEVRYPGESEHLDVPQSLQRRAVSQSAVLGGREAWEYQEHYARVPLSEIKQMGTWKDTDQDGFNDNYQPGGSLWRSVDNIFTEDSLQTPAPLGELPAKTKSKGTRDTQGNAEPEADSAIAPQPDSTSTVPAPAMTQTLPPRESTQSGQFDELRDQTQQKG